MINSVDGKISKKWLTLKQAADHCGMAYQTARKNWRKWERFGVSAYKLNRKPLFKAEELDRMIEMHQVN